MKAPAPKPQYAKPPVAKKRTMATDSGAPIAKKQKLNKALVSTTPAIVAPSVIASAQPKSSNFVTSAHTAFDDFDLNLDDDFAAGDFAFDAADLKFSTTSTSTGTAPTTSTSSSMVVQEIEDSEWQEAQKNKQQYLLQKKDQSKSASTVIQSLVTESSVIQEDNAWLTEEVCIALLVQYVM
jgi:hypothetical protein